MCCIQTFPPPALQSQGICILDLTISCGLVSSGSNGDMVPMMQIVWCPRDMVSSMKAAGWSFQSKESLSVKKSQHDRSMHEEQPSLSISSSQLSCSLSSAQNVQNPVHNFLSSQLCHSSSSTPKLRSSMQILSNPLSNFHDFPSPMSAEGRMQEQTLSHRSSFEHTVSRSSSNSGQQHQQGMSRSLSQSGQHCQQNGSMLRRNQVMVSLLSACIFHHNSYGASL